MMTKGSLEIHSENILPIIKKWLYSDKEIFVRELVSNATDAIQKVKVLKDSGELTSVDEDFRIDIQIDKPNKILRFIDNGIGMDAEEVKKYIAQIAFSGAEEFVEKYKSSQEKDQFIGHFGLGFYSAYMVADKVEIDTLSYRANKEAAFWSCDGSAEYILEKGKKEKPGTEISLFINNESEEFLEESRLKTILQNYCAFLPFPIYLNGQRINSHEPLWMKAPSECKEEDYLEFYRYLYPHEEDPLFWVHLNADYPFHLKGILYFPTIKRDFDITKTTVKLFCNRVFVSDNCKDILPEYLMVMRGVVDSPDIPLNVSRSYLQMDNTVRQLSQHISKKVSDSLSSLFKTNREKFISSWKDISPIAKLGAIQDEKFFDRVKDTLVWKTLEGEWKTIPEYLELNKEKTKDKILYSLDDKQSGKLASLYHQKKIDVFVADNRIDPYLFSVFEKKNSSTQFKRIDSAIDDVLIDKSREKTILDAQGKTEAGKLADFFRGKLNQEKVEVEAKSLSADDLPAVVVIDENERRMRDYIQSMQVEGMQALTPKKTFVVNTNHPLVNSLPELDKNHPELAEQLAKEVFELSCLSQKEMDPQTLQEFVHQTTELLNSLVRIALKNAQ
ncbi:Chaperone protein HtpG [Chlamydiales bacterium STE3]|nr:Chaperone protein HtpG [Chlamydiales bacterium STE3]